MKEPECYKSPPSSLWTVSLLRSRNDFIRASISGIKGLLPGGPKGLVKKLVSAEQKSRTWCLPTGSGAPSPRGSTKTSNVFWDSNDAVKSQS